MLIEIDEFEGKVNRNDLRLSPDAEGPGRVAKSPLAQLRSASSVFFACRNDIKLVNHRTASLRSYSSSRSLSK